MQIISLLFSYYFITFAVFLITFLGDGNKKVIFVNTRQSKWQLQTTMTALFR